MSTTFILPPRPPPLSVSKTYVYKIISKISIPIDIYLPPNRFRNEAPYPIILFIHGGGWTGGNRTDYSRPLFSRFLAQSFIVASMDYRLLPETPLAGQLEDVRDVEPWLRHQLQASLKSDGLAIEVEGKKLLVVGASAGAHLALLTPKLWPTPPTAILSLYGPTNMHTLPYLGRGRLSALRLPPITPSLLASATNFDNPPTEIRIPKTAADYLAPRGLMGQTIFRRGLIPEFLLRGLILHDDSTNWSLPESGCVSKDEVDSISPLALCEEVAYPPTYQIIGTGDEVFETSHVTEFDIRLKSSGVKSVAIVVPDVGHAFDIWAETGSEVDELIIRPAVEWLAGFVEAGRRIANEIQKI